MFDELLEKKKIINESASLLRKEIFDNFHLENNYSYFELVDSFFFDKNNSLLFFINLNLSKEENKSIIEDGMYDAYNVSFLKSEKDCDVFTGLCSDADEHYTYFICKKSGEYSIE